MNLCDIICFNKMKGNSGFEKSKEKEEKSRVE